MQINWKKTLYQYFMVTLACVIMGVALNVFYMPNKMLSGGIGGVAVLAYYIGNLPMGATSLICNVPLFFLAYKYMDRQYTIGALYGIVAFSISLDAFHFLSSYQVVHDKLLACIAGGVLYGIGAACMYRVGGSSGGTDIIAMILKKYTSYNKLRIGSNRYLNANASTLTNLEKGEDRNESKWSIDFDAKGNALLQSAQVPSHYVAVTTEGNKFGNYEDKGYGSTYKAVQLYQKVYNIRFAEPLNGMATLYNPNAAYKMPEGLEGYVVTDAPTTGSVTTQIAYTANEIFQAGSKYKSTRCVYDLKTSGESQTPFKGLFHATRVK